MQCCYLSCSISVVFLIAMVYMTFLTAKNETIQKYRDSLPVNLINTYDEIVVERNQDLLHRLWVRFMFSSYYRYYIIIMC